MHARTSVRDRAASGRHGHLSWQLQSMRYSLPGTAVKAAQTTIEPQPAKSTSRSPVGQHCPAWTGGVAEVTAEQRRTQSLASEPATARATRRRYLISLPQKSFINPRLLRP